MSDDERAKALFFEAVDLLDASDFAAAEARLREALDVVSERPSALVNLSLALLPQQKLDEAETVARRATEVAPDDGDTWSALASVLLRRGILDAALGAIERAVALAPDDPQKLTARAAILASMGRYEAAIAGFEAGLRADPADASVRANLVSAKRHACDWRNLEAETARLLEQVRGEDAAIDPFILLTMPSTAADRLACARRYSARNYPPMRPLWRGERYGHERIRVAYLSPDFREHPMAYVMAGVVERHDRDRFEVYGFSLGSDDGSPFRSRIMRSFERFFDVSAKSDAEVAQVLRGEEIDIAVDLAGYTVGGRPRVYAMRPAPVQVNFLGYPGTTGSPAIDYIVADPVVIPADQRIHYSEKVVWLPGSYFPNDDKRAIAIETPTRQAEGLPETGFVFGSFNNSYKITPEIFDVWMGLLRDVEASVLWLKSGDGAVADNLRREALVRGIAAERLVFARRVPLDEHLARHRLADLMLDTPLYNAHTTACDALWAGAPFLTLSGETFPARAATSILLALDMPELVTQSMDAYAETAIRLAHRPPELASIRDKIAANRATAALFDTALFTARLEAAYVQMTERLRRGEPPEAFAV